MKKYKITYLISGINYGGAQIGMVRLCSELNPKKFGITVVSLKQVNKTVSSELPDHVSIIEIDAKSKFDIYKALPMQRLISKSDIVVCSLFHSVVLGSLLGRSSLNRPKIYTWRHNTKQNRRLRRLLYKFSYHLSDGVFVDSESTKKQMLDWGITAKKITKLPISGIIISDYPCINHTNINGKTRVGTVGRLVEEKGYPELIKCAGRLTKYEFHVIGDGPLKSRLQSVDNIICHGRMNQEELHEIRKSLDVYFQPSRREGLCITAIEAMASKLPVVASNVDGLSESIIHNKTGFLVDQGDILGYCSHIEQLANNPELRNKFGKAGKDRVTKKYSAKAFADQFQKRVI